MPSLWFIVPVHGRLPLTAICLRQLRRTCDALIQEGIDASAIVIADRENLRELGRQLGPRPFLGFQTYERDNRFLSRKFNDGIQAACDPKYNPRPVDYVVPCGSDDWVDHRILLDLPPRNTIVGFQHMSFVREDGGEMTSRFLNYVGGSGIRIYPHEVLRRMNYRPADEDRYRACDTSILTNIRAHQALVQVIHRQIDPRQLVDWKSPDSQLNSYQELAKHRKGETTDPFVALQGIFPAESLREMRGHYRFTAPRLVAA